jgi:hypothetical protein
MYFQRIPTTILLASTLSIAPWTAALAQTAPEEIIDGWVKAATGVEFLKISHGGISHDASSNITTINDLIIRVEIDGASSTISSGNATAKAVGEVNYSISFPAIEFANLALDNGYYSAKSIKAKVAKLQFDIISENESSSSSASGTYDDFLINNMRWSSLPEIVDAADKPISKYYPIVKALTDISFDDAFLGGMTMKQVMGDKGINMDISYGSTKVGKTVSGNFSNMLMSGMKMSILAPEGSSPEAAKAMNSEVTFGDISVSGYNIGTFVRNFEPGNALAGDAPYATVIGDMAMRDMRVSNAGGSFSLGQIAVRDFGVRPPKIAVLDIADKLYLQQISSGKKPDPKKLIELVANIYGAFRLGDFELAGIEFDAPGAAKGKLDLYRVHDLSANGLSEFSLKGINGSGAGGEYFNLDLLSLADIKFPALEALMNLEEAGKNNDIAAMMKAIPTLGKYQTSGLEIRVPGKGEISLKDSKIEMANFIGPIPTKLDAVVNELKMPVSMMEGRAKQVLSAMGFKDILVSYGLKAAWDEASKILAMNTAAQLKDGGDINVDVSIGGIPRSMFENPMTAQQVVALLTVNSANVSFDDQSVVDKGMGIVAAQQGVDVATLKAQAVGMLPFVLQVLNKPQFVNELSAAVKKFLDTNGIIVASATPAAPVSIIQLIGVGASAPGAIIDLLNVKVRAE